MVVGCSDLNAGVLVLVVAWKMTKILVVVVGSVVPPPAAAAVDHSNENGRHY